MAFLTPGLSSCNKTVKSWLFIGQLQRRQRQVVRKNSQALLHVSILSPGKTKEQWLNMAMEEYIVRLRPFITVDCLWTRDDRHLLQLVSKQTGCLYCLDSKGSTINSVEFQKLLYQSFENGKVCFVIGGPEGLPQTLKNREKLLSLSSLTFTHQ